MKKKLFTAIFAAILFSSCSVTLPITATSNTVGNKVGSSQTTSVFGLCFNGDASIRTAAKNGGITKISTVEYQKTNILNVVVTYKTVVTGE